MRLGVPACREVGATLDGVRGESIFAAGVAVGAGGTVFPFRDALAAGAGLADVAGAGADLRGDLAADAGAGLAALAVFGFVFGGESDFFDFIGDRVGRLP